MVEENNYTKVVCFNNDAFDTSVYLFCNDIKEEKLSEFSMFH